MGANNSINISANNSDHVYINTPERKLLQAFPTQSHEVHPNITIIHIKNIKFDNGDGIAPESTFTVFFDDGSYVKIKVDDVDSENHIIKFTALEGSILNDKFEKISSVAKFEESGDKRTIVKLSAEYHTKDNHEPTPAEINVANEQVEQFYKAFEEYIIDHPNIHA